VRARHVAAALPQTPTQLGVAQNANQCLAELRHRARIPGSGQNGRLHVYTDGALREGLLYDMLGRLRHEDARERTVRAMCARYSVDVGQAERVAGTAYRFLLAVQNDWGLTEDQYHEALSWAARLHEIGLDIAHSKYHEHGAYLLRNADLPGLHGGPFAPSPRLESHE